MSVVSSVTMRLYLHKEQRAYLLLAKERSEIELRIVNCVVDQNCYDLQFTMYESDIEIFFIGEEVIVDVTGKHTYSLEMELDLDNFDIVYKRLIDD